MDMTLQANRLRWTLTKTQTN